ncbi:signal transduction histidine kinase/ActR/RegA family two-component response regulator [Caulobacter rhizosphaerae]|uniref:histidine kinase n=1 Tax=Caulobacter rhizosphaerae TaxID=2010972 RepID=A0ABU1N4G3_9CAUL|nr:ATP-binding protein [Caulobacter rhizosphaerae]MDR6533312.1 signal transduction histidine kinase/ActR/RegA family two-component response regulator [Caulobacter rhizosphaerae]
MHRFAIWADDRLDEVALDTHRLLPSRLIPAALTSVAVIFAVGAPFALGWLAALAWAEGLARLATRRFRPGVRASPGLRAGFVLAALPINLIWSALGALLWFAPGPELKMAAVAIWAGQIVYTQNFRHQPVALLAVSAMAPMTSLIAFPLFFYDAHGVAANVARWSLIAVVLTAINVMAANRAAANRLDALTQNLREERERALEANRAKSTFVAVTSHELRTPMNGLLGMAHALDRSNLDDAQRRHVRLMIKSGDSLMQVLNDVLDLSKIEAGRVDLDQAAVNLHDLVHAAGDAWRDAAAAKGLELRTEIDPSAPAWILADPQRIRQVLMNLISNGLKFTSQGGLTIQLSASEPGLADEAREVRLRVVDTGAGIDAQVHDRIFESFTQADNAVSRSHGGTGLGLTISRALARQMGGDLVLESGVGGAAFLFTLRAVPIAAPAAPPEAAEDQDGPDLGALRILMAEDNAINQVVVRTMLEATGVVLTIVDDGQAALDALKVETFDAVLMNINMPVMDGMTALAAIRAGQGGDPAIPVIALTASAMSGDRERFLAMGFDDHLGKPVRPIDLLSSICAAARDETGRRTEAARS